MSDSKIEWTEKTWNPVRGCSLVSAGCTNCYAMRQAHRFSGPGQAYEGLTRLTSNGPVWTGKVILAEDKLEEPLHWKKPARIFVNSMSDLFHESLPDEAIDKVFAVMALCPQHTFQVLTKRADRMYRYLTGTKHRARHFRRLGQYPEPLRLDGIAARRSDIRCGIVSIGGREGYESIEGLNWPLPNVWLGVSVENQETADERIPWLLKTPASVRWVSYEPAIGPVDFSMWHCECPVKCDQEGGQISCSTDGYLDWVIVGGESGPGARPFNIRWARDVIANAGDVPVFVKQVGAKPYEVNGYCSAWPKGTTLNFGPDLHVEYLLKNKKGGLMEEWPEDLRIREYPTQETL